MKRYLFLLLMLPVIFIACEKMDSAVESATPPPDAVNDHVATPFQGTMNPGAVATIVIGEASFSVEIAESDEERRLGLMNRESIPPNYGMWFVFPELVREPFWMKDTQIPLDIIFVGDDMRVVDIIKNATPGSEDLLKSKDPYRYVLEVNSGSADRYDIEVGDAVEKRVGPK
ncbi:MAG: hypothetical protein BWY40_00970 [bacterium ADurb.Bin270]|nr:DUF192 domain-containing protein [Myxococcales bacterium]OQA60329.1 MAG: hypothetical protein BWY40_00970 [bacterium ADurb.Bin270]HQC50699.1 DUF192 domain-containing protein [bacterium]